MSSSPDSGASSEFTADDVDALVNVVAGPVFMPGDDGYAEECATYNVAVVHRPAVIVGASVAADVQAAVRFARSHGLAIAVLATGHGPARPADGAVLVTTRRMAGVQVDANEKTVRVEAGARVQQVLDATIPLGLAPITGSAVGVGVVGFTLGGGLSPTLGRLRGWAADHVRTIDVVTADGALRHVTATQESDLFWAIRGGKDNFGFVTALELDLFEVPRLFGGGLYFDAGQAAALLDVFTDLVPTLPDEMTISLAFLRLPPAPFVPEPLRGRFTVHVRVAYLGSAEEGERLIAPLRTVGAPIIDTVGEMPYSAIASIHNEPPGPLPIHDGSLRLSELPPQAARALLDAVGPESGCTLTVVELRHLGGALRQAPAVPNAVAGRDVQFQIFGVGVGGPDDAARLQADLARIFTALEPWKLQQGSLNYLSGRDATEAGVRAAFGEEVYGRLAQIKRSVDPGNLFRVNHNVVSASEGAD
jgi:FAD/FMN-containing dehydrogenase